MKQYDLSILIPSRNEMFIARTVKDILEHKRGNTEVIVGLDGAWSDPGIEDHPDVRVIYVSESIGQRAMCNKLCKLSTAKYVAKSDAHCSFDNGFDVKLLEAIKGHDDWTVVPTMKNLHAFDWVCPDGHKRYQGPSGPCTECGKPTERDILWFAKPSPNSTSFRFDRTLHFQYFMEFKKRPEGQGAVTPTMSLQGSFFMMTRDKWWQLDICDEKHGSWGQQGTEVACKTWLSGGQVMCVQNTWYAHMFRTQGGDFGFPYPQSGKQVDHARKYSRELFLAGTWDKAIHPLTWLIDKFSPVPDWESKKIEVHEGPTKGIIFYTDNQLNTKLAHKVQDNLRTIGLPIVSASLKPMPHFGKNVHLPLQRGIPTYFKQILAAIEASESDIVFFCEHDNYYHPSHFDFTPTDPNKFYYDQNWWKIWSDGFSAHWDANQVSGLCCYKELALQFYKKRLAEVEAGEFNRSYEPGGRDPTKYEVWFSEVPSIDIRHAKNLTRSHRSVDDFRDKSGAVNFVSGTLKDVPGYSEEFLRTLL